MTYRVYITKDSKAEIQDTLFPKQPLLYGLLMIPLLSAVFFSLSQRHEPQPISHKMELVSSPNTLAINKENASPEQIKIQAPVSESYTVAIPSNSETQLADATESNLPGDLTETVTIVVEESPPTETPNLDTLDPIESATIVAPEELASHDVLLDAYNGQQQQQAEQSDTDVQKVTIRKGDNMALIFKRLSLSPQILHEVMSLGEATSVLKSLRPGQIIEFTIQQGKLHRLEYDYALTKTLQVERQQDSFKAETIETELEKRVRYASANIQSSLFLAGQRAGITDKVLMNLVSIYGWDIDFALDIRSGDEFAILYEEHFKDGKKINNGPILAAEFINQGHRFRAVRYTHENGDVNYYSDTGHNMRKAFIRTPVNFSRISSHFNLKRKHPVLNKIRAHKGVDYAARTGTPIKAAGDGVVSFKGTKGGYGHTIILKHGGTYTTLYAHMSKYAKGMRKGVRVKQGQTIGYVGKSGLATGPHLHYEFRINGVHRNPLKVKLPKALKIPDAIMADFKRQTQPILAELDQHISQTASLTDLPITDTDGSKVLAMRKTDDTANTVTQ